MTQGSKSISYVYNADGLRTSKTVNGVTTEFYWLEGRLLGQKTGNNTIFYLYDENGEMLGFTYGGQSYYYVKNLQGDVIALLDESCSGFVAEYTYSVWGELLSVTGNTTIGNLNPIRYRGYYYDTETGFYYLQSRYYDPEVCRFINADGMMAGVSGTLEGFNLFAYCFNNPINLQDSEGNWPKWMETAASWVNNKIIQPVLNFVEDVSDDIRNFDLNNQSEEIVLKSNYFSFYKEKLVLRTCFERSGSFGILFISKNASKSEAPADIVRHEYGHTKQLDQLGAMKYLFCIGIPSIFDWGEKWGNGEYYNKPWEVLADFYGEVESREHNEIDINAGHKYMRASDKIGPMVWIFIE